ncbi:MAG: hypothetical protein NXI18_00960 [Alphaproteobacteria bacterium]|nr:hypothetical protein [Alphaproteobacteria bacterium]
MDNLIWVFAFSTGVAAALASLAIWAPRLPWARITAVVAATALIPISYIQFVEFLSRPKPQSMEWMQRNVEAAEVLGVSLAEGEAIYMWLRLNGELEPRYYKFPWNLRLAEQLEEDIDTAMQKQGKLVLRNPFENRRPSEFGDLNVEIVPPPLPPTKAPPSVPRFYNPRDRKI